MKQIFTFIALITTFITQAQVSGQVKDAQGQGLSGATITLYRAKDTAVVKLALSNDKGQYSFAGIQQGSYRVGASYVGYTPSISNVFEVNGTNLELPAISLLKASADMKNVVVTARKPMVEVKADKTILNVEGTINATGSDALDLLRKSPGVTVDKDENLSLSGKNGVQVFIDGRPTPLSGQDLASYLKTLPSSQIESIELITNPSARYEAAGNAGIINIRLKKNKSLGTNGTVTAGMSTSFYTRMNGGFSLNHRNAKVNVFGNYNYNYQKMRNQMSIYRSVSDSLFNNDGVMVMTAPSHNFKAGMDYFINKKSTIGVTVNGTYSEPSLRNNSQTIIQAKSDATPARILKAGNNSEFTRNNINYNLNYQYNDPKGSALTVNADHGRFTIRNDQNQPNYYYSPNGQPLSSVVYNIIAPTSIQISSGKVDWEQNFLKGKLGVGGKTAFIKTDNDFQRYNVTSSGKELDKDRSNRFVYKENINAGYVNYNRAFKGIMIQAGLRVENTVTEGTSTGQVNNGSGYVKYESVFKRNYTDLFPSAALTFNKNPMSQLSLTYSRRIDRPAYQDLNPFELKLDEYTFQKGNINLRAQYTNSFGLTHTYKFRLNTTINYSHVGNMIVQLPDTTEKTKAFLTKRNLASQDIVSLNISYPFQYKNYSLFANVNSNYSFYKANFGNGRTVDLKAFGLSTYLQNTLKVGKTWTTELTAVYTAPTVLMGTFQSKTIWGIDGGIQKSLFNNMATVKVSVSDIFNTMRFSGTSDFAGQKSTFTSKWESRQFKLSLNFRFGNNGVKAARQRSSSSEDELKRAQGGGNGIGIGN